MSADNPLMAKSNPMQIECLACGAIRVAFGATLTATGECPRCGYLGWTYADDLDGTTQAMIMNGLLAKRQPERNLSNTWRRSGAAPS